LVACIWVPRTGNKFGKASRDCVTPPLKILAPSHGTDWPATAKFWQDFPEISQPAGVGTVFEFKQD
jgi:metal-dependent hydrolase (beta-lactamase superfamily II)